MNRFICPREKWNPKFYATPMAMSRIVAYFDKNMCPSEYSITTQSLETLDKLKDYYLHEEGGPRSYSEIAFGVFGICIATYFPKKENDPAIFILKFAGDGKLLKIKDRDDLIELDLPLNIM